MNAPTSAFRDRLVADLRAAGCVFAEDEADTVLAETDAHGQVRTATGEIEVADYVARRGRGEPSEYILGWAELAGVRVAVGPGVFIPRPWSETLVERAANLLHHGGVGVDLGTGSGAMTLAVCARAPGAVIAAVEFDPVAAGWASRNLSELEHVTVHVGDLYEALPGSLAGDVDVVFGSLPYVPAEELSGLPRDHLGQEPTIAFDGGALGMTQVNRAIAGAGHWLRPGGRLLLEIGIGQGPPALSAAVAAGLADAAVRRDDEGGELFLDAGRDEGAGGGSDSAGSGSGHELVE